MTKDAKEIAKAFDLIYSACDNIKEHDRCDDCPMRYLCLEDPQQSVIEIAGLVSAAAWDDFLEYADNVTFSDEDLEAQHADFERKYEIEERGIDNEYVG